MRGFAQHKTSSPTTSGFIEVHAMNRMEQLIGFVEFDKAQNPGKTHIAEWALEEIYRLSDALKTAQNSREVVVRNLQFERELHSHTTAELEEVKGQIGQLPASPGTPPVAYMFSIRKEGKGRCETFAAIDYNEQDGETVICKIPLFALMDS